MFLRVAVTFSPDPGPGGHDVTLFFVFLLFSAQDRALERGITNGEACLRFTRRVIPSRPDHSVLVLVRDRLATATRASPNAELC